MVRPEILTAQSSADPALLRRVLVVDDSRVQRRILCGMLKKWGYEVEEADSGEAALALCEAQSPDLVLSDWMMPGMNGLEFCRAFRARPDAPFGYFILLTSKSEKADIAAGLDAGADDFLSKPVNGDELRARISAGARILSMHRELSEKNRIVSSTLGELQRLYDTIDQDLMQARKIQQSLVPEWSRQFDDSAVSLLLKPCGHIGGDLVGMFSPGAGQLGLYAIDVSGHGITSAMMTARLGGYLSSTYFDQNVGMQAHGNSRYSLRRPDAVAALLNSRLAADHGVEEYFTMAYATVDLASGLVRMVQAGHPHPLILRSDGRREFVGGGGVPIGLLDDVGYDAFEAQLEPGDRLLLYSDGFTECRTRDGTMLDDDGLLRLIDETQPAGGGREFLDDLFWNLTGKMVPDQGLDDDVSAALLEFRPDYLR